MSRDNDESQLDIGCFGGSLVIKFSSIADLLETTDFRVRYFAKSGKPNFKSKTAMSEINPLIQMLLLDISKIVGVKSTKCCPITLTINSLHLHLEKNYSASLVQPPVKDYVNNFLDLISAVNNEAADKVC